MKVYLASPFFNESEKKNMEAVLYKLRCSGYEVFAPYEFVIPKAWSLSNEEWARKIFKKDAEEIDKADIVIAINYGMESDSGTAWEIGYASAKEKPIYLVCFQNTVNSLMTINSAEGSFYIEDIVNADIFNFDNFTNVIVNEEQK